MLLNNGTIIQGVNVENAAYPVGVCAERTALATAVVQVSLPGYHGAIPLTTVYRVQEEET